MRRFYRFALGAVPVALLLVVVLPDWWRLAAEPRLPQWDMAKYSVSGLRLAGAIASFAPGELLRQLNGLSVWPPLFPLLEAPFFLVFGKSEVVATRLVLILWAATLLLLPWALRPLTPRQSPVAGWLAAATLAAGTLYPTFANLVMLEVPGLFLAVLALGFSLRACRFEPGAWRATYLCCTLLFFCKYNYFLLFAGPLLLFRARLGAAQWRDLLRAVARPLLRLPWRSPLFAAAAAGLLALLAIPVLGPFEFSLFGHQVQLGSIGNPVFFLLWLGVIFALWGAERRRRLERALAAIDAEHQGLLRYLAAPILVWMLLPPHLKDFFAFVDNRSSQLPFFSAENLLFYPRVFFELVAPSPLLGWAILLLAVAGLGRLRGTSPFAFLVLWLLTGALALQLHPYKQDRFLFQGAFVVVALAAGVAADWLERLPPRFPALPPAAGLAGLLALAAAAAWGADPAVLRREVAARSVPAEVTAALDAVLDAASPAAGPDRPLLLGTWNLFSPWLLEERAWQRAAGWQLGPLPREPRELVRRQDGAALAARVQQAPSGLDRVLLLEQLVENPAYAAENAWLSPLRDQLRATAGWCRESVRDFPAAAYRLTAWRRCQGNSSSSSIRPPASEPSSSPLARSSANAAS